MSRPVIKIRSWEVEAGGGPVYVDGVFHGHTRPEFYRVKLTIDTDDPSWVQRLIERRLADEPGPDSMALQRAEYEGLERVRKAMAAERAEKALPAGPIEGVFEDDVKP